MTMIYLILAGIFAVGVLVGLYAWLAPRATGADTTPPAAQQDTEPAPAQSSEPTTDWTSQAGEEFAGLSESARCDLIFAVAHLDDDRSHQLLVHAMDDPSDAVATAAAHALAHRGSNELVPQYALSPPGARADRCRAPQRGCRVQAPNAAAVLHDCAGPEKSNAGDDISDDIRRGRAANRYAQIDKRGCSKTHQSVGPHSGRALTPLPFRADDSAEYERQQ